MSDSSANVPAQPDPHPNRFKPGNKLGKGNPMARAITLFRTQIIRELKRKRSVPALVAQLQDMALQGRRRFRYRDPIKDTEGNVTGIRWRTGWEVVDEKVQLAAIQELLSRAVGKSTEFKVVEKVGDAAGGQLDLATLLQTLIDINQPREMWPPQVREYEERQSKSVEAKVIEGPKETI